MGKGARKVGQKIENFANHGSMTIVMKKSCLVVLALLLLCFCGIGTLWWRLRLSLPAARVPPAGTRLTVFKAAGRGRGWDGWIAEGGWRDKEDWEHSGGRLLRGSQEGMTAKVGVKGTMEGWGRGKHLP